MTQCTCQENALINAAAGQEHVPDFSVHGFAEKNELANGGNVAALAGVHALNLAACVSASYQNGKVCFNVPIYGPFCVSVPVQIPVSAALKACVQTCGGSFIPTGLKVSIYMNSTVIWSGVVWGHC